VREVRVAAALDQMGQEAVRQQQPIQVAVAVAHTVKVLLLLVRLADQAS
jgi:hypothetical protein